MVVSVGRRPLSDGLGLDGTGVEVDERGFVEVDDGAAPASPACTPSATLIATPATRPRRLRRGHRRHQGHPRRDAAPVDYGKVPWCIYCHPEVAFAGLSEEAAKEAGLDVVVSKHRFAGNGRALIIGEPEGMVKVIAEKDADGRAGRILGVHMVGPWVTEQLGQGYLAVNWEATVDEVAQFIQPHPTLSEDVRRDGAGAHGKGPARLMADITMPQLGETVTEGTITKWFKQVGDQVAEDEVLFEVSDRQGRLRGALARSAATSPRSWCRRARRSTSAPCWP